MSATSAPIRKLVVPDLLGSTWERERSIAVLLLLAAALARLVLGTILPLVPDEAYYWQWSRRLATGYFDHPPAIAVLIRGGTALLGDTPIGVRLLPQLAGLVAMLGCVHLATRLGGRVAARRAAIVTASLPIAAIGLIFATPDAPLLLMATLTLLAMERAVSADPRDRASLAWWIAAGVCLGLAFLSKYTAVLLPLGALIAMLTNAELRRHLARPGPYVAGAVAITLTTPVVLWNARHDWVSFAFQLRHGFGKVGGSLFARELDYFGAIALLVSPVLFVLLVAAVGQALRRRVGPQAYLLAVIATTWVAFFTYSSLRHRPEPNWAAPALIGAVPLIALGGMSIRRLAWLRRGVAVGLALTLIGYAALAFPRLLPAKAAQAVDRSFAWDSLVHGVAAARGRLARRSDSMAPGTAAHQTQPAPSLWIATERYQLASELAFHLSDRPTVFSLNLAGRANQYDYWPGFSRRAALGDDMLLVLEDRPESSAVVDRAAPHFVSVRRVDSAGTGGYRLWYLRGWRGGWPRAER